MKRSILIVLLVLATGGFAFSQFALGVKLGYNGNKLTTGLDSIKEGFNHGFHVGVWTHFGKRLYFGPELLYSFSGGEFTKEGDLATTGWKQRITVGSIDIPLLLGFKIIHSKAFTWRIELGPEGSFVVNKKVTENGLNPPLTTDDINTANWNVLAGTGIDFLFMNLNVRYKYGFTSLVKDVEGFSFDTKNNMLLISLGFKIFGKK